jgi:hypothetical protein
MDPDQPTIHALQDPESQLERAFIDEFLRAHGSDSDHVNSLPADAREWLLREASIYAAGRLTEVEARARLVHELHSKE